MELKGILICHYFSSREQLNNYTAYEESVCNTFSHYRIKLSPFPFNVGENKDISNIFCFDHNLKNQNDWYNFVSWCRGYGLIILM